MKHFFILGTRPEAIKMAPLIKELSQIFSNNITICSTGQHRSMLKQVFDFFKIIPDYDLNVMKENQSLVELSEKVLKELDPILEREAPDNIFVQGDTTSAFIGALVGFYKGIKVSHIEAGLRSHDITSPFPEEGNRKLISQIASYHFCPSILSANNLNSENISDGIYVVGNTVIDALHLGLNIIESEKSSYNKLPEIDFTKKIILVTGHRRESFGKPFENICDALIELSERYKELHFVYPVHLNPNVQSIVFSKLGHIDNISLMDPLEYPDLIWLMKNSYLILTDSGGIQEEAPSLGKPVLVMRDVTERTEGIDAGTAKLVGTDKNKIIEAVEELVLNERVYTKMAKAVNPYGDGTASRQISQIFERKKS